MKLFLLLALGTMLFAESGNCDFRNKDYTDVCNQAVKKGVSYEYANKFLLSYFKTKKFDEQSWRFLQPKQIEIHKQNEKKANNTLVKYIPELVEHLKKYKEVYDYSEKKYGVNREIVASILLKETHLGKIKPTHDAFVVFNTTVLRATGDTPREKWLVQMGKSNMAFIIAHCYKRKFSPDECNLPSSYAGAIGIPQFMPNSFPYTDGYETETADLGKMEDAIMSASKFLHEKDDFSKLIEWDKVPEMPKVESAWYDYDFEHKNASFIYKKGDKSVQDYNCFTCEKSELEYVKNYIKKIMHYNNSSNYAVGVMRLAYDAHKAL